jgi:hypothetical protein
MHLISMIKRSLLILAGVLLVCKLVLESPSFSSEAERIAAPVDDLAARTATIFLWNSIALCLLYVETGSENALEAYRFSPCSYSFAKAGPSGREVISLQKADSLLVSVK